jgi:hypothetical protein
MYAPSPRHVDAWLEHRGKLRSRALVELDRADGGSGWRPVERAWQDYRFDFLRSSPPRWREVSAACARWFATSGIWIAAGGVSRRSGDRCGAAHRPASRNGRRGLASAVAARRSPGLRRTPLASAVACRHAERRRWRPASDPSYRPWLQRRIAAGALSEPAAGLAIAAATLLGFLVWHALGWALDLGGPRDPFFWQQMFGPNVINSALIGYAPAAMAWSRRQALGELTRLAPLLPGHGAALRERIERFPRVPMALAGAGFGLLILPLIVFDPSLNSVWRHASVFGRAWLIFVNVCVGWLMTRAVLEELRLARIFSQAGEKVLALDLFDLAALEPFARRGVESVLVWSVGASLLSLIFAGEGWASDTLPFLVAAILLPAGVALVLPLLGVHRSIRAAKQAELTRIHARARADREALLAGAAGASEAAARLPALLALRSQVADVREWPLDLPSIARLTGFLAIGLASWVGAALVDFAIEAALR